MTSRRGLLAAALSVVVASLSACLLVVWGPTAGPLAAAGTAPATAPVTAPDTAPDTAAIADTQLCAVAAPDTVAGYTAAFAALPQAGDATLSVALPSGRIAWIFADTLGGQRGF